MEIVVNVLSLYKTPNKNMSVCLQAPLHLIGEGASYQVKTMWCPDAVRVLKLGYKQSQSSKI